MPCKAGQSLTRVSAFQAERTSLTLDEGKELYGLEKHELLWEPKHDTKCLLAFGPDAIVVAFRGTASLKNASADIQVGISRRLENMTSHLHLAHVWHPRLG